MRGLITSSPGGWANTTLSDVELRTGRPDEVLVKIKSAGLNPADNFQIEGRYPGGPKPPFISGRDACGIVVQADASGQWKAGDAVVVLQSSTTNLQHGTLCEQQWIAAENLALKPADWSDDEASVAPLVFQTAWKALVDVGALQPGQIVVVTGASGGVGLAAVQLARAYGATVVALSRSEEKRRRLIDVGAHYAFASDDDHLKQRIADELHVKGVHLVVETVGGPSLATSVHLLNAHGRISVVGLLAGVEGVIPLPALMFKRASIHGILVSDDSPEKARSVWAQIVESMNQAKFRPIIDSRFPFESAQSAFAKLNGNVFGKVVVEIN